MYIQEQNYEIRLGIQTLYKGARDSHFLEYSSAVYMEAEKCSERLKFKMLCKTQHSVVIMRDLDQESPSSNPHSATKLNLGNHYLSAFLTSQSVVKVKWRDKPHILL